MLTLIAFIILMVGAINWFCIGLLQFDFVAGLFGSQSSIFSRLIYFAVGLSALVVLYNLVRNRGRIVFDFKNREETTNDLKVEGKGFQAEAGKEFTENNTMPNKNFTSQTTNNMETGKELAPDNKQTPPELIDDHENDDFCHECDKGETQADHYETTNSNPMPKPSNIAPKNPSKNKSSRLPLDKK